MTFLLHTLLSKLAIKHKGYFALAAKHATHILTPCYNNTLFVSVFTDLLHRKLPFLSL